MIERRIREALDALTEGAVPDDLGADGVAGRFRRRQRRNRVGGVVASAVFVGAAVVGVSQFNGGDAVAVTTAGTQPVDEAMESAGESGRTTTTVPATASESSEFGLIVAERSDGPFEWSRSAGADPTLDVILGLQLGGPGARAARYAATSEVLGTVGLTQGAEPLASVVLQLVQIDGSTDVQPFDLTIAAAKDADNMVRYRLSVTDPRSRSCTTSGLIEQRGVLYALDIEPSAPACEGPTHRLFDGEFALEVNIDEQVTVTSASGQVAVFRVGSTLPPSSAGGELGLLISNDEDLLYFDDDGEALLRPVDEGLVLFDPLSGRTAPVVDGGRPVLQAVVSPDGSTIAYIEELDDRFALLISKRGSDEAVTVFDQAATGVFSPSWSPDGTTLAFNVVPAIGDSSGSKEVWVVDVDSLVAERISEPGLAADGPPQWSPDGSQLLFHDGLAFADGFVLVDESRTRDVVDVGVSVVLPIWSPNGEQIAFWGFLPGESSDLWSVAPDGSGLTRLADVGFEVAFPTWSPDGRHIAFIAATDEGPLLYVVGSGGEDLTLLAADSSQPFAPVWSPDSTQLALQGPRDEILIIDVNTGARRFTGQFGRPNDWR